MLNALLNFKNAWRCFKASGSIVTMSVPDFNDKKKNHAQTHIHMCCVEGKHTDLHTGQCSEQNEKINACYVVETHKCSQLLYIILFYYCYFFIVFQL